MLLSYLHGKIPRTVDVQEDNKMYYNSQWTNSTPNSRETCVKPATIFKRPHKLCTHCQSLNWKPTVTKGSLNYFVCGRFILLSFLSSYLTLSHSLPLAHSLSLWLFCSRELRPIFFFFNFILVTVPFIIFCFCRPLRYPIITFLKPRVRDIIPIAFRSVWYDRQYYFDLFIFHA